MGAAAAVKYINEWQGWGDCEQIPPDAELRAAHPDALFISATTGEGLADLLQRLTELHARSGKV